MNQDVDRNRKLFYKEASKVNRGKVDSCNRINYRNGKLALAKDEYNEYGRIILRIYIIDTQEQVAIHICGFDGVQRGN